MRVRHPCEPSEYQFHFGRSYLRETTLVSRQSPVPRIQGDNRKSGVDPLPNSYPLPNSDLDILFGVKKSTKPAEFVANVQYDKLTGEC